MAPIRGKEKIFKGQFRAMRSERNAIEVWNKLLNRTRPLVYKRIFNHTNKKKKLFDNKEQVAPKFISNSSKICSL